VVVSTHKFSRIEVIMKRPGRALAFGAALLLVFVSVGVGSRSRKNSALLCREPREISFAIGTEKQPLINDPKWQDFHEKGCWKIVPSSMGSGQIVANYNPQATQPSYDLLWPAGDAAIADLREKQGSVPSVELRAQTPLVVLAGKDVYNALEQAGAVRVTTKGKASMSTGWIVNRFRSGEGWSDLGAGFEKWPMRFVTTHPALSNSGRNMAALIAMTMAGTQSLSPKDVKRIEPDLQRYYEGGELKSSTGDLFEQFVQTGGTSQPLIVAYEFEVVEAFRRLGPQAFGNIKVVYLENTLVNSNPLLGVEDGDLNTDDAKDYLDWLRQPENAKAFAEILEEHGFRVSRGGGGVSTAQSSQNEPLNQVGVFLGEQISYAPPPQDLVVDLVVKSILKGRCEKLTPEGALSLDC
jgi:hypothetical protein